MIALKLSAFIFSIFILAAYMNEVMGIDTADYSTLVGLGFHACATLYGLTCCWLVGFF